MRDLFLLLHIISSVLMGIFLTMPLLTGRIASLSGPALSGFTGVLHAANRAASYALIIAFLTGGYLVGNAGLSVLWMIVVFVLFLALAAFSGILGKRLRVVTEQSRSGGQANAGDLSKIKTFALISAIAYLLILVLMVYRYSI